jgi:hypothetical protein
VKRAYESGDNSHDGRDGTDQARDDLKELARFEIDFRVEEAGYFSGHSDHTGGDDGSERGTSCVNQEVLPPRAHRSQFAIPVLESSTNPRNFSRLHLHR